MSVADGALLRIFIGEGDRYERQPLYEWIITQAKARGLAGATVLRGLMGFGANTRVIHTFKIERQPVRAVLSFSGCLVRGAHRVGGRSGTSCQIAVMGFASRLAPAWERP